MTFAANFAACTRTKKQTMTISESAVAFTVQPIGRIHSTLLRLEDCPLQGSENAPAASLEIYRPYLDGIKNLAVGDKLLLLTWFHLADRNVLTCYRRNMVGGEVFGVFSTRSPDRPNPIGLHEVTVLEIIDECTIKIFPMEARNGTPVIDIKPLI